MADPQNDAAAVTPAQSGQAQPAAPVTDDGFERISKSDLQALHRERDRARGMEGFFQKANQHGFKRGEDFDKYGKFAGTLKSRGLTLEQMTAAFEAPEQGGEQPSGGGFDQAALDKYLEGKKYLTEDQVSQREARTLATVEHKQAMTREGEMVKQGIQSLLGENATAREKYLIERAVKAELNDKRGMYPDGHPLKDTELAAHDEKSWSAVMAEIKKAIALGEGEDLAKLGDEAAKPKTPTPAGASGSQTPTKPSAKTDAPGPRGQLPAADIQAHADRIRARRGQGPVSSAR
jgi:hypothetical protein